MISISVIVPVYNSEAYIRRCVDSIINQTLDNIEIILIDDGSTDKSGEICDLYATIDNRVKVIHQKNAGVSAARNVGIDVAVGEYIGFVDSDDWIELNMYEKLLCEAKKSCSDVVMCDVATVFANGRIQVDTIAQLSGNSILEKTDFSPSLLLEMAGSVCRCIYSKHIYSTKLCKHSFAFPIGVKFSEDRIFNLYAFSYANRVSYIKEQYYNRFINAESAVHKFHPDYYDRVKKAHIVCTTAIESQWGADNLIFKAYDKQFVLSSLSAINNCFYRTSKWTFRKKYQEVERICNDERIRSVLESADVADFRVNLIIKKRVLALCVIAKLLNLAHHR